MRDMWLKKHGKTPTMQPSTDPFIARRGVSDSSLHYSGISNPVSPPSPSLPSPLAPRPSPLQPDPVISPRCFSLLTSFFSNFPRNRNHASTRTPPIFSKIQTYIYVGIFCFLNFVCSCFEFTIEGKIVLDFPNPRFHFELEGSNERSTFESIEYHRAIKISRCHSSCLAIRSSRLSVKTRALQEEKHQADRGNEINVTPAKLFI